MIIEETSTPRIGTFWQLERRQQHHSGGPMTTGLLAVLIPDSMAKGRLEAKRLAYLRMG